MPPKPKFTKEEIVFAAKEIVREKGLSALTARAAGQRSAPISCAKSSAARQDLFLLCSEI